MSSPRAISLTGNIGVGKSLVCKIITSNYNFHHIEADKIGHEVLNYIDIRNVVVNHFGTAVLNPVTHLIDRKKLGDIVFNSKSELKALVSLVHPFLIAKVKYGVADYTNIGKNVIFEAAILFEAKWNNLFKPVICVICDEKIQLERIQNRNKITKKQAEIIIRNQMPQNKKASMSDFVIDSTKSEKSVEDQVYTVMNELGFIKFSSKKLAI